MGLNNEHAVYDPIVFDLETAPLENAADYLDPVKPDGRLTDAKKIEADIIEKAQARLGRCALDYNVGRIVALGYWTEKSGTVATVCKDWEDERLVLGEFWRRTRGKPIIGFNAKGFDCRYLIQRSRYLSVPYPQLDM